MPTLENKPLFDPFTFEHHADPYPLYAQLRAENPVMYNRERDFFALSRFEDVQLVERDWRSFSHEQSVDLDEFGSLAGDGDFLDMDPPRHDVLRGAVREFFTPKAIAELESHVRDTTRELLSDLRGETHVDIASRFAWQLPLAMISDILGVPVADRSALLENVHGAEYRVPNATTVPPSAVDAIESLRSYFFDLCAEKAAKPTDDVVSAIAAASDRDPSNLPREAVPGLCFLLFVAGVSTTASLIGNTVALMADAPQHRHWFTDPSTAASAVEEILRYEAPIQYFKKTATVDVVLHDTEIPTGSRVVVLYGSANRDERVYDSPEILDFGRDFRKHKSFGDGIHFCLGAHLARLEGRVALEEFFSQVPDYRLGPGEAELIPLHHFRGYLTVPLTIS